MTEICGDVGDQFWAALSEDGMLHFFWSPMSPQNLRVVEITES